jgi:hypothetical protein
MFFVFKKFKNPQFFVLDNAMSNISGYIFLEQMGSFSVVVGCFFMVGVAHIYFSFDIYVVCLFCFVVCLVCPMLHVLLDCPFWIAPLVFSNKTKRIQCAKLTNSFNNTLCSLACVYA